MEQIPELPAETSTTPALHPEQQERQQRRTAILLGIGAFVIVALLIIGLVLLIFPGFSSGETVARVRDIFIIIMAFESLLIGAVLVILMFQIARLTNLLQNEIKPILTSTNETISTLRGTTKFLSDNMAEPVIRLNEYLAGLQKLLEMLGISKFKL